MSKRIQILFFMVVFWLIGLFIYGLVHLNKNIDLDEKKVVSFPKGQAVTIFFRNLNREGIIDDSRWISLYTKLSGKGRAAKAGEYELLPTMSALDVLYLLIDGKSVQYNVTLVEGHNIKETLKRLKNTKKLKYDLPEDWMALMPYLGLEGHPEGRFFPDTYSFTAGTRASEVLARAQVRLERVLAEEWQKKADGLPYKNKYEALIMASIVEKETAAPEEREQIAGVFVRRLEKRMRLETDPTVIYGMGDRYKGNIRRKDLRKKTPYNTYRIKGLPPTPIALVGREAIYAALHPAEGEELYFVAKGDGRHYFSKTLAEHNKAVREYQINKRKKEYRSTPDRPIKSAAAE